MDMLSGLKKDVKITVKRLIDDGWIIKRIKKHVVMNKDTRTVVVPKSPSDPRSLKNSIKDAKHSLIIVTQ